MPVDLCRIRDEFNFLAKEVELHFPTDNLNIKLSIDHVKLGVHHIEQYLKECVDGDKTTV
jgi:hypothetical protein